MIQEGLELTGSEGLAPERPLALANPPESVAFQELRKGCTRLIYREQAGFRKGEELFHGSWLSCGHIIGITNRDAEDNLCTISSVNLDLRASFAYGGGVRFLFLSVPDTHSFCESEVGYVIYRGCDFSSVDVCGLELELYTCGGSDYENSGGYLHVAPNIAPEKIEPLGDPLKR